MYLTGAHAAPMLANIVLALGRPTILPELRMSSVAHSAERNRHTRLKVFPGRSRLPQVCRRRCNMRDAFAQGGEEARYQMSPADGRCDVSSWRRIAPFGRCVRCPIRRLIVCGRRRICFLIERRCYPAWQAMRPCCRAIKARYGRTRSRCARLVISNLVVALQSAAHRHR